MRLRGKYRRSTQRPWESLLQRRRQREEQVFTAHGTHELHSDGQPVGALMQREADRGLTGRVEKGEEALPARRGRKRLERCHVLVGIVFTKTWEHRRERRSQQHVESLEEFDHHVGEVCFEIHRVEQLLCGDEATVFDDAKGRPLDRGLIHSRPSTPAMPSIVWALVAAQTLAIAGK